MGIRKTTQEPKKHGLGSRSKISKEEKKEEPKQPKLGTTSDVKVALTPAQLGKRPLGRSLFSPGQYKQEAVDVSSSIFDLDYKRIVNTKDYPIEMVDGSYIQLMAIRGKDLDSLSEMAVVRTLISFEMWLSTFSADRQIVSTTLPTDTTSQQLDIKKHLSKVRTEKGQCSPKSRRYLQLEDREKKLMENLSFEEQIQNEMYNKEFVLFLYAPNLNELNRQVRLAMTKGNNDFVPYLLSKEKKYQILKQYNNQNEKI